MKKLLIFIVIFLVALAILDKAINHPDSANTPGNENTTTGSNNGNGKGSTTQTPSPVVPIAVAVFTENPTRTGIEITGKNLGASSAKGKIEINLSDGSKLSFQLEDSEIVAWKNDHITILVNKIATKGTIKVTTDTATLDVPIQEAYLYDWLSIPRTANTNASPLALASDTKGRVWINQEFHRAFHVWEPSTGQVRQIQIPLPPGDGPYATVYLGTDARTGISVYGEDIAIDQDGYVWFTEGGDLYGGKFPNHSRIVRYDPNGRNGSQFRFYNIPGDNNLVIGIAFDTKRNRVWFTSATHNSEVYLENGQTNHITGLVGSKLTSFDPERVPYNDGTSIDYSSASKNLICKKDQSDATCYHEYPIPIFTPGFNTGVPSHIAVDTSGNVWYATYWGSSYIGRLNPNNGAFTHYPLPKPIATQPLVSTLGSGIWYLGIDKNNNIVITETLDSTMTRLRTSNLNSSCEKLDAKGNNPCIDEQPVPHANLSNQLLHSLAFDSKGNTWFAQTSENPNDFSKVNALGYVTADWKRTILLPPLTLFTGTTFTGTGITIDKNGTIWFGEYIGQRLGRLQKK